MYERDNKEGRDLFENVTIIIIMSVFGWKKYLCCNTRSKGTSKHKNINDTSAQDYEYVEGGFIPPIPTIEVREENVHTSLPPPPREPVNWMYRKDNVGQGESSTLSSSADHFVVANEKYRRNLDDQVQYLTEILETNNVDVGGSNASEDVINTDNSAHLSFDATTTKTEDMNVIRRMNRAIARDDWSAVEKEQEGMSMLKIIDDDLNEPMTSSIPELGNTRHSVIQFSSSGSSSSSSTSLHSYTQSDNNTANAHSSQHMVLISNSSSDEEDASMAQDLDNLLDSYRKQNSESKNDDGVDLLFSAMKQSLSKSKRKSSSMTSTAMSRQVQIPGQLSAEERRVASDNESKSVNSFRSAENSKLNAIEL